MRISSSAFKNNDFIPEKYTCDGSNINPPLSIVDVPKNVQSLALVVDDPDAPAGTFTHWLVWNINPNTTEISGNYVPQGSVEGLGSFGKSHYGGPCPGFGTHRYFFKIFALDTKLNLSSSSTIKEFLLSIQNHILAKAELIGKYSRK